VTFRSPESTACCKEAKEPGINPSCNGSSSTCDGTATVIIGGSSEVVCSMFPAPLSLGVCPVGQSVGVCPVGQQAPIGERNGGPDRNGLACSQNAERGDITHSGKGLASQLSRVSAYIQLRFLRNPTTPERRKRFSWKKRSRTKTEKEYLQR